jgi:muramidase (phage lysozyme)
MAQIQRDGALRLLGKTTDDINSAGASFVRQQVIMGRRQVDLQGDLGTRTRAYILELDRLQKLTGTSADALQKQQEELMSEDAYNVYMSRLEEQGQAGQEQAAKIRAVVAQFPQYSKDIALSIGGNVEAQQKLMFLMPNLIRDLRDPTASFSATLKNANKDLTNYQGAFEDGYLIAADAYRDLGGSVKDYKAAITQSSDIDARNAAAEKNAQVTDANTKRLTEAQIANMNSRDAMQSFIQQGVAPATIALGALAKVASGLTGGAAGAVGASTGGAASGSAPGSGRMDYNKMLYGGAQAASGDVDRILATIRKRESGGNYGAKAAGSSASGAYQFIDSTWQSMTKKFGMGTEFASAGMAPKEIQDAVAKAYVQDILKRAGGDVSKVPLEWYTGNLQGAMSPAALRANNGLTAESYQSKWMSEFQKQGGTSASATTEEPGWVSMLSDKLDTLNNTNREQRDIQQKQLQVSS